MQQIMTTGMKPLCDCLRITQEVTRVPQPSASQKTFVWPGRLQWPSELGGCVGRPTQEGPPSGWRPRRERGKITLKVSARRAASRQIVSSWMRRERRLQRLLLPRVLPEDSSPLSARQHKVTLRRRRQRRWWRRPLLNRKSPASSSKAGTLFPASLHFKMWQTGTCWLFLLFVSLWFSLLYIVATMHGTA